MLRLLATKSLLWATTIWDSMPKGFFFIMLSIEDAKNFYITTHGPPTAVSKTLICFHHPLLL